MNRLIHIHVLLCVLLNQEPGTGQIGEGGLSTWLEEEEEEEEEETVKRVTARPPLTKPGRKSPSVVGRLASFTVPCMHRGKNCQCRI